MTILDNISKIKKFIYEKPAFLLLLLVFLFIIPHCLSYDNAWVQPEQFYIKMGILQTGPNLNSKDLKTGLFWQLFEYQPRCTRPLSSYFEIIDTKFRCWLWHYILPHPSLSLTWIFSFILAPLLLYRLLRNYSVSPNVSMAMVAFYLVTPGVLSYEAMLFRPAKPMTNFSIILCLYLASQLKRKYVDQNTVIPLFPYLCFWATSLFSIFWDETALLILPALFFVFPRIFKQKNCLVLWLFIPVLIALCYFKLIPYLSILSGNSLPQLKNYDKWSNSTQIQPLLNSLQFLTYNAKSLVLETMGIVLPDVLNPSKNIFIKLSSYAALLGWGVILFYFIKTKKKWDILIPFLLLLILFFNHLVAITMQTWGPFYYGSFWSVFFVIYLARFIEKAQIPKMVLTFCVFFILINMTNCFLATNKLYKTYHYYPYSPGTLELYFRGEKLRFEEMKNEPFTGSELKSAIYLYWIKTKMGMTINNGTLPKELCWLPLELEPKLSHERYFLLSPATQYNNPLIRTN